MKSELKFLLMEGEGYNLEFKESEKDLMKAEGLTGPQFEISEDWFTVIFIRPHLQRVGKVNEGVNALLDYIAKNPGNRIPMFVKALSVPAKTIERWIKQLKD